MKHNKIPTEDIENIKKSVQENRKMMDSILEANKFDDEITQISKEDFASSPLTLSLSDSFYENKIYYTYEEYMEHLKLTKEYEKNNKNYSLITNSYHAFKNIQILIFENNWIMISKNKSPSIHFVIHHPKLRNAIENFIPPVIE